MRADRLLQIVSLLRRHGRLSAADLAARLEVHQRTILRDMEALSVAGVPVYAERGRTGGFTLLPGYRPALELLTAAETEALLLAGSTDLAGLGRGGDLSRAIRKLADTVPELARSAEAISSRIVIDPGGWFGASESLPWFGVVQQAVLADRRLRLHYRRKDLSTPAVRTLDPYGLVQAAGTWYLIAAHRGGLRTYRVSRITDAESLPEPSRRPSNVDLAATWAELRAAFVPPAVVPIRLEIVDRRPQLASIMLARTAAAEPRVDPGPPMIMDVDVLSLDAAVASLAGLGAGVRVLDPPELIIRLRQRIAEAAAVYDD